MESAAEAQDRTRAFLVVEDDPPVARAMVRALRSFGVAETVGTVTQGLRAIEAERIWTGLLIDVGLPDGSGFDVLAHAREVLGRVPVLVTTGRNDWETTNKAYDLEATYLCKPIEQGRIVAFARECDARSSVGAARISAAISRWRVRYRLTATEVLVLQDALGGASREQIQETRHVAAST